MPTLRHAPTSDGRDEPTTARDRSDDAAADGSAESSDVLALLGDAYACRVLAALDEEALPATELVDRCDASRSTVYRRLDRLEALGLVESRTQCDPDGHHRKVFHLSMEEIRLRIGDDGVLGRVARAGRPAD